jgi:hypothetical protein
VTICWLLFSFSIFFFVADDKIISLGKEDGFFETAGAIFFLLSAILFFLLSLKSKSPYIYRKVFFILLGCAFLFAFLEEISWGQRIFNLTTPQSLQEINMQKEINLHNLEIFHRGSKDGKEKSFWYLMLNMDRLFSIFWFSYCCLLPLLYKFNYKTKITLQRIDFPIVPIFIGVSFFINYLFSKIIMFYINPILFDSAVEIKESNIAFLFLIVSILFVRYKL